MEQVAPFQGFFLGEATAAERTARDRLTYSAWGGLLSREQYLDRERLLRQTDHGRHAMHTWVLRLPNGVIVASCETFRLPLLPTGAFEVVASVFVDGPLRNVGMARRLLEALVANRREAGIDGLILFSEVGPELYARCGFQGLPRPTRVARVAGGTAPPVTVIRDKDLPEAIDWRNALRAGRVDFRLLESIFDWHQTRSEFYAATLGRSLSSIVGARLGAAQALWLPDFKNEVLRVLDVTGAPGASLDEVLAVAAREAAVMGLRQVEVWDDAVSLGVTGGCEVSRESDEPMGIAFTPRGELLLGPVSRAFWA